MNLTFPVFTPPAASSYGSTMPMRVPWEPPNLAGAINEGIKSGATLATSFMTGAKTVQEIRAQEAASKAAIAAMHDPNLQQNISYELGPSGFTARVVSPAEVQIARAGMVKTQAETEASRAATAERLGQTPEAQARIAKEKQATEAEKATTAKTQMETGAGNVFEQRSAQAAQTQSGLLNPQANTTTTTSTADTGTASTDGSNQTQVDFNQ
jgi:hypothetical protein